MRQTIAFSSPLSQRMRVAFTHSGQDVWIEWYLVRSTGTEYRTEHSYIYASPDNSECQQLLEEELIDHDTLIEELSGLKVKLRSYAWRPHALQLWKKHFGDVTWRDDKKNEMDWDVKNKRDDAGDDDKGGVKRKRGHDEGYAAQSPESPRKMCSEASRVWLPSPIPTRRVRWLAGSEHLRMFPSTPTRPAQLLTGPQTIRPSRPTQESSLFAPPIHTPRRFSGA